MILLVFIVPFSASVKEKTEIKNMKTNNQIQALDSKALQSRLRDEGPDPGSG